MLRFGIHLPNAEGIVLAAQIDNEVAHSGNSHLGDDDLAVQLSQWQSKISNYGNENRTEIA